jgi:hypothetical protein
MQEDHIIRREGSQKSGKCSKAGVCFPDSCITICQNFPIR